MNTTYLLFDLKRTLRNRRVMIFSILMPLVLFLVFGMNLTGQSMDSGMSAAAYVMISMAMFGSMSAAMSIGGAIATERDGGWNRTLRLTPLKPQSYITSKIALSLGLAIPPLLVVFAAGVLGADVRLSAGDWLTVALTAWLGSLPFAALGLIIGYVAKPDSVQPISGLTTMLVAAFGGLWLPVDQMPTLMRHIAEADARVLDRGDRPQPADPRGIRQYGAARGAGLDDRARRHRPPAVPRRHRPGLALA